MEDVTTELLNNFPFQTIREQQKEVLQKIGRTWEKYRYIIMECPTGFGKSPVSYAIGKASLDAFLITSTKQLQDQYSRDFKEPDVVNLKGKINYTCAIKPPLNVECGPCVVDKSQLKDCKSKKICPYYSQREKALHSQIAVLSTPFFLYSTSCGDYWKPRDVLIIDECHLLEGQIVQWATLQIQPNEFSKEYEIEIPKHKGKSGYNDNKSWLNKVWNLILRKRSRLFDEVKDQMRGRDPDSLSSEEVEELLSSHHLYYRVDKLYKKFQFFFDSKNKESWLCEPQDEGVVLTPIDVSELFNRYIQVMAIKKVFFMSATILDTIGFAKNFGLSKEQTGIIKVESDFPPENSPIIYKPCGSMKYTEIDKTIPKIIDSVKDILNKHSGEKGIIHTANYKLAKSIFEQLNDERILFKTEDKTNEKLLEEHYFSTKPTVLVSPSLTTGTDLKDEFGRFQIILKLPWSSLSDKRISRKTEIDGDWYVSEMFRNFVQASGRSTRSAEDWSVTYVLDSSFYSWVVKYRKWFSKSFLNRIIWKE